jgi:hypothetical protein
LTKGARKESPPGLFDHRGTVYALVAALVAAPEPKRRAAGH